MHSVLNLKHQSFTKKFSTLQRKISARFLSKEVIFIVRGCIKTLTEFKGKNEELLNDKTKVVIRIVNEK